MLGFALQRTRIFVLIELLVACARGVHAYGLTSGNNIGSKPITHSFSVPLKNPRPKPTSLADKFIELWNDPRPITSLVASADASYVRTNENDVPYCVVSDEFDIGGESFQILLYPCGRFAGGSALTSSDNNNQVMSGAASAYLRYLPKRYGDEIDIAWRLRLSAYKQSLKGKDIRQEPTYLHVITSGGLPRSNNTWSAAMTFCSALEAVESLGRTTDWGSSIWSAEQVSKAYRDEYLFAEGEISVFAKRSGESLFALPLFAKGGLGSVYRAVNRSSTQEKTTNQREFKVGEVIVARNIPGLESDVQELKQQLVYPGIDYRIMTMTDKNGIPIFSTNSLESDEDKCQARLSLRPCGWKLQHQLWKGYGMQTDWPIEIDAGRLVKVAATRFNPESAIPRIVSAFKRDWRMYSLALAVALTPIPLALVTRNFVSFYVIPTTSMEPSLLKGDLMMVEKLPRIYERTHRGDVVLFRPPSALVDIVRNNGSQLSSSSLFVKRIVGLPGDEDIILVENNDVLINSKEAVGPDRNLCPDEPLRLINSYLKNGIGIKISKLGKDEVYVLGDCKAVSVDSRVFGPLPKENIVGKPIARIWPINRFKLFGPF
ncbi:hypothetical protein HJC23_009362 [Cyclotella cryptica]|uniref:Mitochondrial inner membrane protease subunit n=1 Tax=Cyclotella cryptica TaxID=29204 RepID=A0ABD3QTB3_9STRA|eukprot:CCRYP_002389-RA/>CCRYP_002389-RA protein AED:0.02 eAED:0.02 QI:446/1/1/1/0/0/2/628/600